MHKENEKKAFTKTISNFFFQFLNPILLIPKVRITFLFFKTPNQKELLFLSVRSFRFFLFLMLNVAVNFTP